MGRVGGSGKSALRKAFPTYMINSGQEEPLLVGLALQKTMTATMALALGSLMI